MSFVQVEFIGFLTVVYLLYWGRSHRVWQNSVLVVASACFYGWITPWWLILLYTSATIDFTVGQLMLRSPRYRRLWLAMSLCSNIGLLLYFKYFNFFIDNVVVAMTSLGMQTNLHTLNILLPAGISFYTFQTLSYTIDIYRGELRPRRSYLDYLAFVSFFPQLVAGPIERASRLIPQLEVPRQHSFDNLRSGFGLALYGAFKKVVIADTIAPYVDKVFLLESPSGPMIWMATFGFMLQIYADFSGYTDLARGIARMLGIDLIKNFDEPYMAASTPEFWQRWHISLSSWIRDYVLTPLLGDQAIITRTRFAVAIFVTMVVMGAWHGAGWNFIAFGVFHSFCILFYVLIQRHLPDWVQKIPAGRSLAVVVHFIAVGGIGSLMFREPSFARFLQHVSQSPFGASPEEWHVVVSLVVIISLLSLPLVIEHYARRYVMPRLEQSAWYPLALSIVWSVWIVLIGLPHRTTAADFIYFQF